MAEVQLDGQFWLPAKPDRKIAGWVTFSPTAGGSLTLLDSFEGIDDLDSPRPDYSRILGESIHGGLTLDDCRLEFLNLFQRRQRFAVGTLLNGAYYESGEAVATDRLVTQISDLMLWMLDGVPALNFKPEQLASGTIPLVKEHSEHIDLGSGARLNLIHRLALSKGVGLLELRNTTTPQFEFDTPVELDAALEHAFDLLDVVTIAADRVVAFEDVTFSHPDLLMPGESRRVAVGLHEQWRAQADPNRKQLISDRAAFTFGQLGGGDGLRRLLEAVRNHRALTRQIIRPLYDTAPTVQDSFFTRVAALEGLDKQQHGGGSSLRERLKRLAGNAGASFASLVGAGDAVERWAKRMVALRNNIGHGDPVPLHQSAAELHEMSDAAYWLFVLNLLVEANAPADVYTHLTTTAPRFAFLRTQIRRHF
ncbi:ApeA N-terminal domain 1-containing protein [Amycolatopsis sp. NPDC003865]